MPSADRCKNAHLHFQDTTTTRNTWRATCPTNMAGATAWSVRCENSTAAADVRQLLLFHHDPDRTDDELDVIQEETHAWLQKRDTSMWCTAAFEGLVIDI